MYFTASSYASRDQSIHQSRQAQFQCVECTLSVYLCRLLPGKAESLSLGLHVGSESPEIIRSLFFQHPQHQKILCSTYLRKFALSKPQNSFAAGIPVVHLINIPPRRE